MVYDTVAVTDIRGHNLFKVLKPILKIAMTATIAESTRIGMAMLLPSYLNQT